MDKIILGILLLKKMTIYEIRAYVRQNMKSMCSDSMGSIQAAIKKLISGGHIEVRELEDHGVIKKEYQITDTGRIEFSKWVREPMDISKSKNMEAGKFFFLGFLNCEERLQVLDSFLLELKGEQAYLLGIKQFLKEHESSVIDFNVHRVEEDITLKEQIIKVRGSKDIRHAFEDIYGYQVHTLEYGIQKVAFDIAYYEVLRNQEVEKKV